MFIDERERQRERCEREHQSVVLLPPVSSLTWDQTCNLGMCPDQELNLQPFVVQDDVPIN